MSKELEDYHWLCPEPFGNIRTSPHGYPSPCCIIFAHEDQHKFIDYSKYPKVSEISHKDWWNSDMSKRFRNAMKHGGDDEFLNAFCRVCKNQEASGNRSHRQWYLARFENDFAHKKEEFKKNVESDEYPSFLYSIELDHLVGNVCNLSCVMCDSISSSSYDKEAVELGEKPHREVALKKDRVFDKDLYDIVNMSEEIKFAGGEPLMSKNVYKVFEMVENPEDKTVRVVTNGTKFVEKFIESTKNFKKVTVNLSLESVEEFNDYLRYPIQWNDFYENVQKFENATNVEVYLTPTYNAINVGRLHELYEYFDDDLLTEGSLVEGNEFSLRSVPPDIKDLYLNRLYHYGKYSIVRNAIKYLENVKYEEYEMYSMLSKLKRRDRHRNTNLLDHVPEWKKYYENCISY